MAKKTFKKQILRFGKWFHPNAPDGVLEITRSLGEELKRNFEKSPYVPIFRGHIDNEEAEKNPKLIVTKNIKGLELDDDGINAVFELNEAELDKYNDVSVRIESDYEDHETGELLGSVLKHIALVADPYIKKLKSFIALNEPKAFYINLSDITMKTEKTKKVDLEEEVKDESSTEEKVEETKDSVKESEETKTEEKVEEETKTEESKEADEESEEAEEESNEETEEESEEVEGTKEEVDASDVQQQIIELQETVKKQSIELAEAKAEKKYQVLLSEGKVLPAQEAEVKELFLSAKNTIELADGNKKPIGNILDSFFKKAPKIIEFGEKGVDVETGESKGISSVLLSELRKSPEHASKTDEEWNEYVDKNKGILQKYS